MQRKIKLMSLVAATFMAGTAGAFAQGYQVYGSSTAWEPVGPRYGYVSPQPMYWGPGERYGALNGSNHPTPSSTQGDVGPQGNNNGTLSGYYRQW